MRPGRRSTWSDRTRGQATVELALGLPVVVLALLLLIQLVLVGRDAVLVTHAAREAARAAALEPSGAAATRGAERASTALDPGRLDVTLERGGGEVTVRIRYRSMTRLPLIGAMLPDATLSASATMAEEPP